MVLIKNQSTAVINTLPNYAGEVLFNSTNNRPLVNISSGFNYFVLASLTGDVSGLSSISATTLGGTLTTAAQPNVTSLGTLTGLTCEGILNIADHDGDTTGLQLNGTLVTSTAEQLNYTDTTPGAAEPGKALILDSNGSITGITNLETDNLQVNGTLVTASAVELNYTDVAVVGVAEANKALVVDGNKDIIGIHNLETDNLTVNGELVTASATELNYTDVNTLGVAQLSKALVVDENKDIVGIHNLSADNLSGTLTTAAQPNITSLGTLTSLNVAGATSVGSLTVGGVSLVPYSTGSLRSRVYSSDDFNGNIIYKGLTNTVDFTDYAPVDGFAGTYSMEVWGYVKALYSEQYTFTINSSDNCRLWINNQLVVSAWSSGSHTTLQSDPILLTANSWYPIYIQHVQGSPSQNLSLLWSSTTQISQIIPSSVLAYDDKELTVSPRTQFFKDLLSLYDNTNGYVSSISTNTAGDILLSSYTNNIDIIGHNGFNKGLKLDGTLVTSSAVQLNYVNTTVGTAQATKAVILDSNKNIVGINNINTTGLLGVNTSSPDKQAEINSSTGDCLRLTYNANSGSATNFSDFSLSSGGNLTIKSSGLTTFIDTTNNLDIVGHNYTTVGLKLAGVLVTASAEQLNYTNTTQGAAEVSKALILDPNGDIAGINTLTSGTIFCDNLTLDSAQVTNLNTSGNVGINTSNLLYGLEVNEATGNVLRLTYNSNDGTGSTYSNFQLDVNGNLTLTTNGTGGNFNIANHDGTIGLKLAGVLVTASALELNYTDTTAGHAEASKALILDASKDIDSINHLTATTLTGTLDTAAQPNITSLGSLTSLDIAGILTVSDTVTLSSTADAVSSSNGGAFTSLGGGAFAKSVYIGTSLNVGTNQTLGGDLILKKDVNTLTTLNLDSNGNLTLTTDGTEGNVNITNHDGTIGLQLAGVLVTASALELNYTDTTVGHAEASKALILDSSKNIDSINHLTATTLTGTLDTAAQPNITSLGSLTSLDIAGILTVSNTVTLSSTTDAVSSSNGGAFTSLGGGAFAKSVYVGGNFGLTGNAVVGGNINVVGPIMKIPSGNTAARPAIPVKGYVRYNTETDQFEGYGAGDSWGSLGGVMDVNQNTYISAETSPGADDDNLRFYNDGAETMRITDLGLVGIGTNAPLGQLDINSVDGNCLRLTYNGSTSYYSTLLMSSSGNLTIKSSGLTTFIDTTNSLDIVGHNGTTIGLKLAGVLLTASSVELNYLDGSTPGTATIGNALVVNNSKDISGINTLTATTINCDNLTLDTAQLTNLNTDGNVGINTSNLLYGLEVNEATGNVLRLSYNDVDGTGSTYSNFQLDIDGNLTLTTNGTVGNFNIANHNGTIGLKLAGVLVTASALELNYTDTIQGHAEASKALILDDNKDIDGIEHLTATTLTGTLDTASQPNITSLGSLTSLDIAGILTVSDTVTLSSTADAVSSSNGGAFTSLGGGAFAKSVYIGTSLNVGTNVTVGANMTVTGPILLLPKGNTAARPASPVKGYVRYNTETDQFEGYGAGDSWGSLGGVMDVNQNTYISAETSPGADDDNLRFYNDGSETMRITDLGLVGIGTDTPAKQTEINSADGNCLRLSYNAPNGSATNFSDFTLSSGGNLTVKSSGLTTFIDTTNSLDIVGHNGTTIGLKLAGVLLTSTSVELNYLDGSTPGTATASNALVLDSSKDITSINHLTATTLTGTLDTAAQPNITSVGLLDSLSINSTGTLAIGSNSLNNTTFNYYCGVTPGTASANKSVVLDSNNNISGINNLTMNSLDLVYDDAVGNTVGYALDITRTTSDTPAVGLGIGQQYFIENDSNNNISFGSIFVSANDVTTDSEYGQFNIDLMDNGTLTTALTLTNTSLTVTELVESSDIRIKTNIINTNLENAFNKIMNIHVVDYNYTITEDTSINHTGVIAQELKDVIPSAVKLSDRFGYKDFHSISSKELVGYLLATVQHMNNQFSDLKKEFNEYKNSHL